MTTELDVAWRYEFMNQNNKISYSTINYVPYSNTVTVAAAGRNTALVSLDLFLQIFDKYLFEVSCDTKWNADYIQALFYLGTGFQF